VNATILPDVAPVAANIGGARLEAFGSIIGPAKTEDAGGQFTNWTAFRGPRHHYGEFLYAKPSAPNASRQACTPGLRRGVLHAASPTVTVSAAQPARITSSSIGDVISQLLCRRIRF
jgi:hypothetical protein